MKIALKSFIIALLIAFCVSCERQVILNPPATEKVAKSQLQVSIPKYEFDKRLFNVWIHEDEDEDRVYQLQFHEYTNVLEIVHGKNNMDTYTIFATGDGKIKLVDQEDGVLEEWDYYFDEDKKGRPILYSKNVEETKWLKHKIKKESKILNFIFRK